MENFDVIQSAEASSAEKKEVNFSGIEKIFAQLPKDMREEYREYFSKLPEEIADRIKSELVGPESVGKTKIEIQFDRMNKEDRFKDGTFIREDIKKFNLDDCEAYASSNMHRLFGRHFASKVKNAHSFESFKTAVGSFFDVLWSNRGKDNINSPEKPEIDRLEKERSDFLSNLHDLKTRMEEVKAKPGNKKRLTNAMEEEIRKAEGDYYEALRGLVKSDFDYSNENGIMAFLKERDKLYKAEVYLSEVFSAEDYAVLMSEVFDMRINHASRYDRYADPELLDFSAKFFQEWADSHKGEGALINKEKVSKGKRTEQLIKMFIDSLSSYLRHKDNPDFNDTERESISAQPLAALRMLAR